MGSRRGDRGAVTPEILLLSLESSAQGDLGRLGVVSPQGEDPLVLQDEPGLRMLGSENQAPERQGLCEIASVMAGSPRQQRQHGVDVVTG